MRAAVWWGRIGVFDGMRLHGEVAAERPGARPLALEIELSGMAGRAVSGFLRALPSAAPTGPPPSSSLVP